MNDNAAILDQRPATSDYNTVLVSIIIPAYNTAEYIHRAIESSIRQTHSNIEIIIIDDGSTDNTLKVSQSYAEKDSRIRVIHQENGGVSSARNHGMREANGEYYVFLDSDDWLEDDAVEVLLEAQIEHPDKLITGNYCSVDTDYVKHPANDENIQSCSLSIERVSEILADIKKHVISHLTYRSACFKIFKANICRNISFREDIVYGEDTIFVFEYINVIGGSFYIDKILLNVFSRPGSVTRSIDREITKKKLQSVIKMHEIMINHRNNTPEVKKMIGVSTCMYTMKFTANPVLSKTENRVARQYIKQYARDFLMCRKVFLKKKLSFMCKVCLPLPISRALVCTWKMLKKIRDKIRRK